ncbi:hypothetical protein IV203_016439 [Nitzschia inconspicua]|uniref:Uncharacterized protein n=1 Tax=Nitzschia inconspicua TaxID=303405 RepID=A0A9K3KPW7_9STRA|nr:hypothetical protein IV203_016439 [Nitzschia inconspicua]
MSSSKTNSAPSSQSSSSESSAEAVSLTNPKSPSLLNDGSPDVTPPQQQYQVSSADAAAAAAALMAQQQYGATTSGHPAAVGGYLGGQQHQPPFAPPPTYDMNAMAAAWEYFQHHQQQQLSPIIYHNSPQGGTGAPQPQLQYPYMYPYPPTTASGGGAPGSGSIQPPPHQQFYATLPYGYPMHQAVNPPSQQLQAVVKPPRRMNSAPTSSTNRQGASPPKPKQNVPSAHAASSSGDLPDMSEIFSNVGGSAIGQSYLSPLVDNSGTNGGGGTSKNGSGGGYGSIPSAAATPKVYNAPPSPSSSRRLPPSGRSPSIPRTDSGNDLQQLSKRKGPLGGSKKGSHRRTHSDTLVRGMPRHKRANSSDFKPPSGASHNRARTLSGGNPFIPKPTHRRTNSTNSMLSQGDASQVSIRSNIVKSSLFAGVDPSTGNVLMHFPYEAIRLVMIPDPSQQSKREKRSFRSQYQSISSNDEDESNEFSNLKLGHLYFDGPVNAKSNYEDYVKISDDLEQGFTPQWESLEGNPRTNSYYEPCGCQCANCNACIGKLELLPLQNYVLPVSDDIYRRMLGEVSSARNMPCGLFFCGHHEDVAHPSIWIAGTLVILLLGTLIALSFYTECSAFQCLSFK